MTTLPPPFYQRGDIVIYNADCLDLLPLLPEVDCVITDPPYGISHPCNFKSRGRGALAVSNDYSDVHSDNKPFEPSFILSLNSPTCLWGANYFSEKLPPSSGWLVWDKERPDDIDQATCELAWTNFVKGVRRFKHLWHGCMKASENGESYHPTQKPIALFQWIFSLPWTPHGTILDPFLGSGPVAVACLRTGRKCIGIEIEEKYCRIAADRCDRELDQLKLFKPADLTQLKQSPLL